MAVYTDHPFIPRQHLPICAAMAVGAGMEEEGALADITINPAVIAGIEGRVGSLTPGKDADIVLSTGHPLDWKSKVEQVYIGGVRVH